MHRKIKATLVVAHSPEGDKSNQDNDKKKKKCKSSEDKIDFRLSDMMSLLTMTGSKDMAIDLENSIFVTWLAHDSPAVSYLMRKGVSLSARGVCMYVCMYICMCVYVHVAFPHPILSSVSK